MRCRQAQRSELHVVLHILRPDRGEPNDALWLTILGGPALAVATVTLGIGLLRA